MNNNRTKGCDSAVPDFETVKLFIAQVNLHTTMIQDKQVFTYRGHRARQVELLGVVVEVIKAEKYTLFTLDDATGCIQCLLWRPMERSFTTTKGSKGFRMPHGAPMSQVSSEARMALEVNQERYALLMDKVHLGSQLKVQGKLHRFQGALQIKCLSLQSQQDPNAETEHRLDIARLHKLIY